jgi:hypothetical protein
MAIITQSGDRGPLRLEAEAHRNIEVIWLWAA